MVDEFGFNIKKFGKHKVSINYDFYLSRYETTVEEFAKFINETDYQTDAEVDKGGEDGCFTVDKHTKEPQWLDSANWRTPKILQSNRHPVVCVSYNDAIAYAKWLSMKTGKHYRLPSEAEWEYAARAGASTKFSCGDNSWFDPDLKDYAWYDEHWLTGSTHPVGTKKPNGWGLYDMHGNVIEWCEDNYEDDYNKTPVDGSAFKDINDTSRVTRGGSWTTPATFLRSGYRPTPYNLSFSNYRQGDLGFRLARDK